jgi:general secretion pathway protein N
MVGCLLLVATASGVADPADIDVSDTDAAPAGQPTSGNPLWKIPLEQLSATRDRPIFSLSRRPPPAVEPAAAVASPPMQAAQQPERPQLSLIGTILSGGGGLAIFVDQATKAPLRIRIGADYQGWMLRQIEAKSVTLQKGQQIAMLSFEPAKDQNTSADAGSVRTRPDPPAPPPSPASTAQAAPPYLSPESNALRMPARPHGHSARRR